MRPRPGKVSEIATTMLSVSDLRKSFNGGARKAVDGVSFDIRRGEIFGLLGPNGAGKSTTIHLAVGLLRPDSGSVCIEGSGSPSDPAVRTRLGVAPQSLAIYDELTAEENLRFFGRIQGLDGKELRERCEWALQLVNLADRRREPVSKFSGGMKRRLNLAVAVVHNPVFLFLDEPTVGVDPQSRNAIFDNILRLREEGLTILYTTHYMEEAQRLCNRVAIMDHGRILALDTVDRLIDAHGGLSAVVVEHAGGETRIETADPLGELLRMQQSTPLHRFYVERPDLESVFLNLTGRHLRD